ncbi:MAG: PEP-CTERM sorting domain-containing protein [Pirellulales bacterium]|nr:PEP-CTERM sorting domain-containing protein [Pirellulales bacterium]
MILTSRQSSTNGAARVAFVGCLAFLVLASVGSAAIAGTVSYNANFAFPLSPGSQGLSLPQWDPALYPGQVLSKVELKIGGNISATVDAENDSAISGNMGVDLLGLLKASAPSLAASAGILQSAGPVAVGPSDGNPGSGPDFVNFGKVSGSGSASNSLVAGLAPYIGNGNIAATVNGNGGFSVTGVSDSTIHVSAFGADGTVTVTYTYNPVPEPTSMALAGLSGIGLALAAWRRRRKS